MRRQVSLCNFFFFLKFVFASDERSLRDHIATRMLQANRFPNIRPYPGDINDHRVEVIKGYPIASIDDYPYTVSLLNIDSSGKEWHVCGGTLIAMNIGEKIMITCVEM